MPISFGADGSFSQPLDLSKLSAGAHVLHVTAMDAAGNTITDSLNVTLASAIPLTVSSFNPVAGLSDVGSTYRPEIFFSRPIDNSTLNANDFFLTDSAGNKLASHDRSVQRRHLRLVVSHQSDARRFDDDGHGGGFGHQSG